MAIAVNGGHISRALDFYNIAKSSAYFVIGGYTPWEDESTPTEPNATDFKLRNVVGLKKVTDYSMVVETEETENVINYRSKNWKRIDAINRTTIGSAGVSKDSEVITVSSVEGFSVNDKIRVGNAYEGKILKIENLQITLDTKATVDIAPGSEVIGGALVEGARHVYVACYLNYNDFPVTYRNEDNEEEPLSYRQIGLCSNVVAKPTISNVDILRAANFSTTGSDEYASIGILEVLDNRTATTRNINQRELISLIIEF